MAASRGERANVTGGKYYCSADLRLKIAPSERPRCRDLTGQRQPRCTSLMKTYELLMNRTEKIKQLNKNLKVWSELWRVGAWEKKWDLFSFPSSGQEREVSI